jgi:hypothetical protein
VQGFARVGEAASSGGGVKDFEFVPVHKEFPIAGAKVTRNAPAKSAAICSVLF